METFEEYLDSIVEPYQRARMKEILNWVKTNYPTLETRIAWNQPMFTDHGTYIIGFSHSKKHISMSPEVKPIKKFRALIEETGLSHTDNIIRIKWEDPIPYDLMETLIDYNIEDKADHSKFWR
jgi:hypothetical protein